MTKIWTRFRSWPMWLQVGLAVLVVLLAVGIAGGGGDDGKDTEADGAVQTTTSEAATVPTAVADFDCIEVTNQAMLDGLGMPALSAFPGNEKGRWFVAGVNGATWYSYWDPTNEDDPDTTIIVPLNQVAREQSEFGTAAKEGAPVYEGHDDSEPGAVRARDCARS